MIPYDDHPLVRRRREIAARSQTPPRSRPPTPLPNSGEEPPLPSAPRMVGNALGSAARAVAARVVAPAPVLAPAATVAARLAVCRAGAGLRLDQTRAGHCDQYRPSDDRCASVRCGCHLETGPGGVPGRARWAALDCPLGRWPRNF